MASSLGRKASLVLGSQLVGSTLGYVGLLFIGRYIADKPLGQYAFALASLGFVAILTGLGFGEAHIHFVARGVPPEKALGVYLRIRLGLALVFGVAGAASIAALSNQPVITDTTIPILAVALGIHMLTTMRQIAFDTWVGLQRVHRPELSKTLETGLAVLAIGTLGLALAAAQGRWTPVGAVAPWMAKILGVTPAWDASTIGLAVAISYFGAKFLSLLPVAWWWVRDRTRIASWDRELAGKYLRFAMPVALGSVAAILLAYTDIVMIGYFLTSQDVGQYNVAQRASGLALLAAMAVATPLLPRFSEMLQEGRHAEARDMLHRTERYLLLVTVPVGVFLATLPGPIIHIAIGDAYLAAALPLRYLALWAIVFTAMTPTRTKVMGSGRASATMVAGLIMAGLIVPLNLWLIPKWGANLGTTGAAVGTLLSTAAAAVYLRWRLHKDHDVPLWDPVLARMALAGAGAAAFWWGAWTWAGPGAFARLWLLAFWGLLGTVLFTLLAWLLGMLRRSDVQDIGRLLSPGGLWAELRGRDGP